MNLFPIIVLIVSAYFLYHGVVGLYKIATRPASGTTVSPGGIREIVLPSDPTGMLVSISITILGGLGVSWGLSRLR
jgi:hypothetical protein